MIEKSEKSIVLITQNTDNFEKENLEAFGFHIASVANDGVTGAKDVLRLRPDIVLCDVFMAQMDALAILEEIREKAYSGVFIAVSASSNDMLAARLMENGADYFLIRPFSYAYLSKRINTLLEEKNHRRLSSSYKSTPQINDHFDLENCVSELMREIGVPAHIRGYRYIRKAILLALENDDILNSITKELYPTIARAYKTTPSRVERAIRHAIEVAWSRGDIEVLTSMFGYTIKNTKGKPTNGEFISMLTDRLRLDLKIS